MSHGECHHLVSYHKDCPDCTWESNEIHKALIRLQNRTLDERINEAEEFIFKDKVLYVKASKDHPKYKIGMNDGI